MRKARKACHRASPQFAVFAQDEKNAQDASRILGKHRKALAQAEKDAQGLANQRGARSVALLRAPTALPCCAGSGRVALLRAPVRYPTAGSGGIALPQAPPRYSAAGSSANCALYSSA